MDTVYDDYRPLTDGTAYSAHNSLSLALASLLAYEDYIVKSEVIAQWGLNNLGSFNIEKGKDIDTQGLIFSDSNNIVIAFRGTENIKDWLSNVQAAYDPGPFKNTNAHGGFQDALYPAVIQLIQLIKSHQTNHQKIWCTGHSLGGALASLFSGMLLENNIELYGLYTFASPRPGDEKFASQLNQAINGPHYRIVNHHDLVPHLPPEPLYSHNGNRIILKEDEVKVDYESWLEERLYAIKEFVGKVTAPFDIIDNHSLNAKPNSYIPRLKQKL